MRLIDADALAKAKFHGYQEIEITPSDVNAESYKRGWNDAIDAIIESTPSIERKKGKWIAEDIYGSISCSSCGFVLENWIQGAFYRYCPNCGAWMGGEQDG